jgi:hypothetical protein
MIAAGDARIDRAEIGAKGIAADDGLDVVIAVARHVGTHDGNLVRHGGETRKRAAEGDAGDIGANLAGGAAELRRRGHVRIERLNLARSTVQEQENDGFVGNEPSSLGGAGCEDVGQAEPAER